MWAVTSDGSGPGTPEVRWRWYKSYPGEKALSAEVEELAHEVANSFPDAGLRLKSGHEGPFEVLPSEVWEGLLREAEKNAKNAVEALEFYRNQPGSGVQGGMTQTADSVFAEIQAELDRQRVEWGGPEHDDVHDARDWVQILMVQVGKMAGSLLEGRQSPRRRLIQIAAVCVSAVESFDRRRAKS